jgi:NAD(P)-dependent dehydrogenase (short-subunit alcohol dehydrogenase family)
MEPYPLEGRTAIVTGASRGIGSATAQALDAAGARVALVARNRHDLEEVAATLGNDPVVITDDLSDRDATDRVMELALAALAGVDILVNNAGFAARLPIEDTRADLIDQILAVNIRAPLLLIGACIGSMSARGGGSIVNLSSVSALVGTPRRAAYAASKGALDAATRSLAIDLGPRGIRINTVAPGVVDTALWEKNKTIPGVVETIEQQTPLRRWAAPEDIADVIVFLATDAARFITGETISVDGGMARTFDLFGGSV